MLGDVIRTERLVLRPIGVEDLTLVQTAAGRREVADTMISIAHPFSSQDVLQALLRSEWSDTVGPPGC